MNYSRSLSKTLALSAALFAGTVLDSSAHSVWIEDLPNKVMVVRFGEFPDERETTPGHLDELSGVTAWKRGDDGKPVPIEVPKKSDHFLLTDAAPTNSIQVETGYDVMPGTNAPGRKPFFYARWQPKGAGAGTPATILDLVPTGKPGEVRVYFRGQPVPDAKLSLVTPADGEQALVADKDGLVHFTATKPGLYMLTYIRHRETITGYSAGQTYGIVSHNAALTWRE